MNLLKGEVTLSPDPPSVGPVDLEKLQRESFCYFVDEANPASGPIADKTSPDAPASIAAVGPATRG